MLIKEISLFVNTLLCYNFRNMKKSLLTVFLITVCTLCGCTKAPVSPSPAAQETHNGTCLVDCGFDTFFMLNDIPLPEQNFDSVFEDAQKQFRHYNDLFDIYNDYEGINNLKTINDNAGIQPVEVEDAIIEMLEEARLYTELSDGAFDITIGSLLSVWHEYRTAGIALNEAGKNAPVPSFEELSEAAQYSGWEHVHIDRENGTVYIDDPHVKLDVGGIAKGFAAEKIAQRLEAMNVQGGLVNAGGNNRMLGPKQNGTDWRIGIMDPENNNNRIVVNIYGKISSVTSGDYLRYYVGEDGVKYHHIVDPETLYPSQRYRSVSVFTEDSGFADCLSTALFNLSYEDGIKLINKYKDLYPEARVEVVWLMDKDHTPECDRYFETNDFYAMYTEGLEGHINH